MKKKVIVLGKGKLAIEVSSWFLNSKDYNILLIVPVMPEPLWTDSLISWAKKNNLPYVKSGEYADIANVQAKNWSIDLAISVFYDKIFKNWFIKRCKKIINIHNSPLPKYRGVSPINWALKNKEKMHGVTIHEIVRGIDEGPIISQVKYSIYPEFDEVIDVYNRGLSYGFKLFQETMPVLYKIKPESQDNSEATYYSKKKNVLLKERRYFTRKESIEKLKLKR